MGQAHQERVTIDDAPTESLAADDVILSAPRQAIAARTTSTQRYIGSFATVGNVGARILATI